jgi:hypothetical protein
MSLFLQIIDRLCKWLGILTLGAPLWWLLLARIDVPLSAEADAWRDTAASGIAPEKNGYYAIIGFYVEDPLSDINRAGQKMFVRYLETVRSEPALREYTYEQKLRVVGTPADLCSPLKGSCIRTALLRQRSLELAIDQNAVLLRRYYSLYSYTHYRETEPIDPSRPVASAPLQVHNLVLASIALQAARGELRAALSDLARDSEFWRMVLHDDSRLLGKMYATRALLENLHLLSDIIASTQTSEHEHAALASILRPLDAQELDLGPALSFECHSFAADAGTSFYEGVDKALAKHAFLTRVAARWLVSPAFRPHDTANRFQGQCEKFERWGRTPWNGEPPVPAGNGPFFFGEHSWDFIYNPIGKLYVYDFYPDTTTFARYRSRVADLDGFVRLVTLQWSIKTDAVGPEDVSLLLQQADSHLKDPYTGAPMNWDSHRRVLWFKRHGMNRGERDRLEVPVFALPGTQ